MPGGRAHVVELEILLTGILDIKLGILIGIHLEKECGKDEEDWKRIRRMGRPFIRGLGVEMWRCGVVRDRGDPCAGGLS